MSTHTHPQDVSSEVTWRHRSPDSDPLWYKDAVIYQLHVRAFSDSNGDGIGDFPGLIEKLDYLAGPRRHRASGCCPSTRRRSATTATTSRTTRTSTRPTARSRTSARSSRAAHDRGLRVITELVINHTSDQHPWFQAARRAPAGSAKRDYYVWSDTTQRYEDARIIFTDSRRRTGPGTRSPAPTTGTASSIINPT